MDDMRKTKEDVIDQKLMQDIKRIEEKKKLPFPGLEQTVNGRPLYRIIKPEHVWQTKGKTKRTIITHDGVKLIADFAGVCKDVQYAVLTQPDAYNNYQYTMSAKVCMSADPINCVTELGEANRSNLGSRGRHNPANMAQKRAYDRAVFRLLGITGILSEEELSDDDNKEEDMHGLSHDEKREIAGAINQITLAKSKEDMSKFNAVMKKEKDKVNAKQLDFLRSLYKKKLGELSKVGF